VGNKSIEGRAQLARRRCRKCRPPDPSERIVVVSYSDFLARELKAIDSKD
jgi:hypothetical protein